MLLTQTIKNSTAALGILLMCSTIFAQFFVAPKVAEAQLGTALVGCIDVKGMLGRFAKKTVTAVATSMNKVPVNDSETQKTVEDVKKDTSAQVNKECSLDTIAYALAKTIAANMTRNIVAYIKSGFKGDPLFISDPKGFFLNMADEVTGEYIYKNGLDWLCDDFSLDIKTALKLNFQLNIGSYQAVHKQYKCKITDVIKNVKRLTEKGVDFENDLQAVFHISQTTDNPYFLSMKAQGQIDAAVNASTTLANQELNWSGGFLSPKDENGNAVTPGVLIQGQLQKTFGATFDQLNLADEFSEIISALMGAAVQAVFGGEGVLGSRFDENGDIQIEQDVNFTLNQTTSTDPNNYVNSDQIAVDEGDTVPVKLYVITSDTNPATTVIRLTTSNVDDNLTVQLSPSTCRLTSSNRSCEITATTKVKDLTPDGTYQYAVVGTSETGVQQAYAVQIDVPETGPLDDIASFGLVFSPARSILKVAKNKAYTIKFKAKNVGEVPVTVGFSPSQTGSGNILPFTSVVLDKQTCTLQASGTAKECLVTITATTDDTPVAGTLTIEGESDEAANQSIVLQIELK